LEVWVLWLLICLGGLLAETWLIVVLGRRATGAYEGTEAGRVDGGAPVAGRDRPG
jgi:hypothetical protein